MLCTLVSAAWEEYVRLQLPGALLLSYLDDRAVLCRSMDELNTAIRLTKVIDDCFGCKLNESKCKWSCTATGMPNAVVELQRFPSASTIKYLGVDICFRGSAARATRPTFRKRHKQAIQRCSLISKVPPAQRGGLISDTMASLWPEGGTRCYKWAFGFYQAHICYGCGSSRRHSC